MDYQEACRINQNATHRDTFDNTSGLDGFIAFLRQFFADKNILPFGNFHVEIIQADEITTMVDSVVVRTEILPNRPLPPLTSLLDEDGTNTASTASTWFGDDIERAIGSSTVQSARSRRTTLDSMLSVDCLPTAWEGGIVEPFTGPPQDSIEEYPLCDERNATAEAGAGAADGTASDKPDLPLDPHATPPHNDSTALLRTSPWSMFSLQEPFMGINQNEPSCSRPWNSQIHRAATTLQPLSRCDGSLPDGLPSNSVSRLSPDPERAPVRRCSTTQTKTTTAEMRMAAAARCLLRPDCLQYLEVELPRWGRWGLWQPSTNVDPGIIGQYGEYHQLQVVYYTICQLHTRTSDDAIRIRIALVELYNEYQRAFGAEHAEGISQRKHGVGRGDATGVIDDILRRSHSGWPTFNEAQQKACRAQFHHRKRYGKRWAMLAETLGSGILLVCSQRVAKMVQNTAITSGMLSMFLKQARTNEVYMRLLDGIRELAQQLCHGQACSMEKVDAFLKEAKLTASGGRPLQSRAIGLLETHRPASLDET